MKETDDFIMYLIPLFVGMLILAFFKVRRKDPLLKDICIAEVVALSLMQCLLMILEVFD